MRLPVAMVGYINMCAAGIISRSDSHSKHQTLSQCRPNVGPASHTLGQHQASIGQRLVFSEWCMNQCRQTVNYC